VHRHREQQLLNGILVNVELRVSADVVKDEAVATQEQLGMLSHGTEQSTGESVVRVLGVVPIIVLEEAVENQTGIERVGERGRLDRVVANTSDPVELIAKVVVSPLAVPGVLHEGGVGEKSRGGREFELGFVLEVFQVVVVFERVQRTPALSLHGVATDCPPFF
jgi:hypothetical protein